MRRWLGLGLKQEGLLNLKQGEIFRLRAPARWELVKATVRGAVSGEEGSAEKRLDEPTWK